MIAPETPADEAARLGALLDLAVLDTDAEERFDRLTRLAARILDMPIALVSLIDHDRQWFKSRVGLAALETSREISFAGTRSTATSCSWCGTPRPGRAPRRAHLTGADRVE